MTYSKVLLPHRDEIGEIILAGWGGEHKDVEIHVKARRPRVSWRRPCLDNRCTEPRNAYLDDQYLHWRNQRKRVVSLPEHLHGPVERVVEPNYHFSGRSYAGVPSIAKVQRGIAYLVTMAIPADLNNPPDGLYPRTWSYPRLKTAPKITVHSWQEDLLHLAAHESRHIHQYRNDTPRSEVDADRWALARLEEWRGQPERRAG